MRSIRQLDTQECLNNLVGIPYSKLDCWELVKKFYEEVFNIDMSVYNEDCRDTLNPAETSRYMEMHKLDFLKVEKPDFGDILLLKVQGLNAHLGVFLGNGTFIHTTDKTGSVIEKVSRWKYRLEGYYKWQY